MRRHPLAKPSGECTTASAAGLRAGLAYDIEGAGTPVVFLHGLTFNRRAWRLVIDRLGGSVTSIAIDLPAHGGSGGQPVSLEAAAGHFAHLVDPGRFAARLASFAGHCDQGG